MRLPVLLYMLLAAIALAPSPVRSAEIVATVLGDEITRSQLAAGSGERDDIARFRDVIWEKVAGHYITERGLTATADEFAELVAYDRKFASRDRAQRARKLEELNQRLAAHSLAAEERAWLEQFRAVLTRLAQDDADSDRAPPPDPARQFAFYAPWIELWKLNKALYEQYGGIVALTRFGPVSHSARADLVIDYERRGLVRFFDARLREQLFALLAMPPSIVVPREVVDFTPYWKRPIPPSYFPD